MYWLFVDRFKCFRNSIVNVPSTMEHEKSWKETLIKDIAFGNKYVSASVETFTNKRKQHLNFSQGIPLVKSHYFSIFHHIFTIFALFAKI